MAEINEVKWGGKSLIIRRSIYTRNIDIIVKDGEKSLSYSASESEIGNLIDWLNQWRKEAFNDIRR